MIEMQTSTAFGIIGMVSAVAAPVIGVLWSLRGAVVKLSTTLDGIQTHNERQTMLLDELFERVDGHDTELAVIKNTCEMIHKKGGK